MGVPLQLILGTLLILAVCSFADRPNLRQIREAPPPLPTPPQNVTEINNRDLNKIVNVNSKTETLDAKTKTVNNFQEFPVKLGKSKSDNNAQKNGTEEKKDENINVSKEKLRENSSRAIDIDASKFWSADFHSKNNVFNFSPTHNVPTARIEENSFEGTRHPSFDTNAELTTPTTILFDQKFKETVESVDQTLDEDIGHDNDGEDIEGEERNDENISVEHFLVNKPGNATLEYEKTKIIVNNETIDKNSIHKDLNLQLTKKVKFENIYNETKVFDEKKVKGVNENIENMTAAPNTTSSVPLATTRKNALLKESVEQKGSLSHLFSNNIETEFVPPKIILSTTVSTTTTEKLNDIVKLTTKASKTEELPVVYTLTTAVPSTSTSALRTNVSDQENVTLLQLGSESSISKKNITSVNGESHKTHSKEIRTVLERIAINISTTTENIPTTTATEVSYSATDTTIINDGSTLTPLSEEGTTSFLIEKTTEMSDATTEMSTISSSIDETTVDSGSRTSKSLENSIVTEPISKTSERDLETSTIETIESTIRNEMDSTTLNNVKSEEVEGNDITKKMNEDGVTTTERAMYTTSEGDKEITTLRSNIGNLDEYVNTVASTPKGQVSTESVSEKIRLNYTDSTTMASSMAEHDTTEKFKLSTTTEIKFVHIENTESKHTTLLSEVLSPNLNYSTSAAPDDESNKIKKILANKSNLTELVSSSSAPTVIAGTTTEVYESGSTDNIFTKGDEEGSNKGKIAAIAISCVGALCLILLAGLLYVMKKRQKRLNYGPRCRPVSLDDYSIDNLSVYNSVRRKGGARMSKRSFGNPAFDDPVAPTHPLNFPALANFSNNYEDIKAEFEEIPQITARTSELPDGCDTKNRYANVIPLPETRVFLNFIDGYPNSDYINANYVTGPKNTKGYYIATQGPMQNTVDDFWRMVWEQQAKVILMLTHLVENGLEKCVDYLPESEVLECSRLFGDFQITLKKREVKEKYIISSLQLKNMVSNSWREVTHFWYLGWPEKGVPSEANSLIAFLIEARSYMKNVTIDKKNNINGIHNGVAHNEHNPVVIHCSPGTGRTGVAIACDIAIREFETTRLVDVPKIVYRIRRDRANAIQTREQYMFIYKVVSLYATKLTGGALENV